MDFLTLQNRINAGEDLGDEQRISARDRVVVVIGGGDTGSDCIGTAIRQGAGAVHQFEILPQPPEGANPQTPWPLWPTILRTSSSQEEGCQRRWSVQTKRFSGAGVRVTNLHGCEVEWASDADGRLRCQDVPGTDFVMPVDLVLLAMGFVHVVHGELVKTFDLATDSRGNVTVDEHCQTSTEGVFAAGDTTSGASLVVRAIAAGRETAAAISHWLLKK